MGLKERILDWRTSFTAMCLVAGTGSGGIALGLWTKEVGLWVFMASGLFAIACIVQGQILVEQSDRHGWISTYAGALLLGALIPTVWISFE
jgi:hypothetical protein